MKSDPTYNQKIRGFTLMELMLVIAIVAVLATLSLGVLASATDDAKAAATRSRVRIINQILQVEMEAYEVRKLPISTTELIAYASVNRITKGSGPPVGLLIQVRNLRRRILQEFVNSEIPRPVLNNGNFIFNTATGIFPSNIPGAGTGSLGFRDWLDQEYPNAVGGVLLSNRLAQLTSSRIQYFARYVATLNAPSGPGQDAFNLPGEYLHQVLSQIDLDGDNAVELLGNRAIGDTDGDGILEVRDGWDEPMGLILYQLRVEPAYSFAPRDQTTDEFKDIYPDISSVEPDFDITIPATSLPLGYDVLDPTIPREVFKVRFEVLSDRLGRQSGER